MSRSRKHTPAGTWGRCKSQKRGKQYCNRLFRRMEHCALSKYAFNHNRSSELDDSKVDYLPNKPMEVMSEWNLGGDGKHYYGHLFDEEWNTKFMRK